MYGAAHLKLALLAAGGLFLVFGFRGDGGYDQFGHGGLEFYVVGSRLFGGIDHLACHVDVAVVVDPGLGYDYDVVCVCCMVHLSESVISCPFLNVTSCM